MIEIKKIRKKTNHKLRIKCILLLLIFIVSLTFTFNNLKFNISNEEFLRFLLSQDNPNIEYKLPKVNLFVKIYKFLSNIDINNPFTMVKNNYEYLDNNVYNSSDNVEVVNNSEYIKDPYPNKKIDNPVVYIYNTHQLEEYKKENTASYNITPNVMMASYILREKLNNKGIPALVEENNVSEILKMNNWNYASSYKVTKMLMEDAKEKNPSLTYYIDLHRDSVGRKISTTTINEKNYARVLFIVGLENSNYKENLEFTNKIQTDLETNYPGLSRGIYKKQGKGVNGIYNQDFSGNTILIEVGGSENTIQEVYNTLDIIVSILANYIGG